MVGLLSWGEKMPRSRCPGRAVGRSFYHREIGAANGEGAREDGEGSKFRVPSSGFHGSGENANKVSGIPTLEPWNR
jgi:hypothetical protein